MHETFGWSITMLLFVSSEANFHSPLIRLWLHHTQVLTLLFPDPGISDASTHHWIPLAEQAVNVIYKLAEFPDTICGDILKLLAKEMMKAHQGGSLNSGNGTDLTIYALRMSIIAIHLLLWLLLTNMFDFSSKDNITWYHTSGSRSGEYDKTITHTWNDW